MLELLARTPRRVIALALAVLCAMLLAAWPGAGAASAAEGTRLAYDFVGVVTEGPSDGTKVAGPLDLTLFDDGRLEGTLTVPGAAATVEGRLDDGNVTVTFTFSDGTVIQGTGVARPDGVLEGDFSGPAAGDRGVWKATPRERASARPGPQEFTYRIRAVESSGINAGRTVFAGRLTLRVQDQRLVGARLDLDEGAFFSLRGRSAEATSARFFEEGDDARFLARFVFGPANNPDPTISLDGRGGLVTGYEGFFLAKPRGVIPFPSGRFTATPS